MKPCPWVRPRTNQRESNLHYHHLSTIQSRGVNADICQHQLPSSTRDPGFPPPAPAGTQDPGPWLAFLPPRLHQEGLREPRNQSPQRGRPYPPIQGSSMDCPKEVGWSRGSCLRTTQSRGTPGLAMWSRKTPRPCCAEPRAPPPCRTCSVKPPPTRARPLLMQPPACRKVQVQQCCLPGSHGEIGQTVFCLEKGCLHGPTICHSLVALDLAAWDKPPTVFHCVDGVVLTSDSLADLNAAASSQ
ncbi:hypothetical protein QTO34_014285 [Cnephaeus nilssonii]|uniref:Uncharacterized protein n=1 Tax=Cnephaeus nilssonii TaxID=3371016 RepID=A0AA40I622_CNENI|nr:hypothetical protein QTO34_014285 [Eptesicus nilssonii]